MKKSLFLIWVLLAMSCSEDDSASSKLTVTIQPINSLDVTISWIFEGADGQTLYRIVLDGETLEDAYKGNDYTFNVDNNKNYNGVLFAISENGDETFKEFNFSTVGNDIWFGNYTIDSQAKANSFNYTKVTGTLGITRANVTHVRNLTSLVEVGNLIISDSHLRSLEGLENLQIISNGFIVSDNRYLDDISAINGISPSIKNLWIQGNPNLSSLGGISMNENSVSVRITESVIENLDGLSDMNSLESLRLLNLPNLTSIAGLSNVSTIAREIELKNLPSLLNLQGFISIENLDIDLKIIDLNIESFTGLNSLKNAKRLILENLPNVQNLEGLSSLEMVEGDFIVDNLPQLQTTSGLSNLHTVTESVEFTNTPNLSSISDLSGLVTVGKNLEIQSLALNSLNGLQNLTEIGRTLTLRDVDVSNLNELQSLTVLGGLSLSDMGIQSLAQLNNLETFHNTAGRLTLINLPNLTSLDGLGLLSGVRGSLIFKNLPSLSNFDALTNIQTVIPWYSGGFNFRVENCDQITNLDAFSNVISSTNYGFFSGNIKDNNALTDLCGIRPFILSVDNIFWITRGNAYNPTKNQMINNACSL